MRTEGPRLTKGNQSNGELRAVVEPYVPTPAEAEIIERQHARLKARGPRAHMGLGAGTPKTATIGIVDHDDASVGGALYMESLGTADWRLAKLVTASLATLAIQEGGEINDDMFAGHQAVVQGIAPQDEIECLLAVQMAAVHSATMLFADRVRREKRVAVAEGYERSLNRLARTFTTQVEALKRHRTRGVQKVIVQHVQVNEGGQALVAGEMNQGGRGRQEKDNQPHERDDMRLSEGEAVLGALETLGLQMPGTGGDGLERLPVSRGARRATARDAE